MVGRSPVCRVAKRRLGRQSAGLWIAAGGEAGLYLLAQFEILHQRHVGDLVVLAPVRVILGRVRGNQRRHPHPRQVLGERLGLEVYGVAAPALVAYPRSVRWRNLGREVLARVRACVDVYL